MIFNSIEFAIFYPIVFILYWLFFKQKNKARNIFLIIVSYFFYGFWDWRFLSLIIISSFVDFIIGKRIFSEIESRKRKILLSISLIVNLGFLGFFKYYNFFVDSFISTFTFFGSHPNVSTLNIILPVGISFYTFQTLSYTLDIYYRKMDATEDIWSFFAFVSFFPQLVAGPIERAKHLLPQFSQNKELDYEKLREGILLVTSGLFKKIVIADRLAIFVDNVFGNIDSSQGLSTVTAVIFFTFQLYFDFSAYSEIAIGTAKMMDFDLSENFRRPYLSKSFGDFWKRWHISLSSWFKDYLYIPLGGNRKGRWITKRNLMIVFLLSGLWHGAAWNFILWGGLNAFFLIFIDSLLIKMKTKGFQRVIRSITVSTFWALSLIFFRAQSFHDAISMFGKLGLGKISELYNHGFSPREFKFTLFLLLFVLAFEIIQENVDSLYQWFTEKNTFIRWSFYIAFVLSIIFLGAYGEGITDSNFIYFQF